MATTFWKRVSVEEAIAAVQQTRAGIDLLIVDAVMPKVSGPELADILLFLRPRSEGPVHHGTRFPDDAASIQSPMWIPAKSRFSRGRRLISKVEEVLGESQSIAEDMSTSG